MLPVHSELYFESSNEQDDEQDLEDQQEQELDNDLDDDSDLDDDDDEQQAEGKSKLIYILIAFCIFLLVGFVYYFFIYTTVTDENKEQDKVSKVIKTNKPALYVDFPKDDITAVLYDEKNLKHHLIIKVVLLVRDENVQSVLQEKSAIILSGLLELLESENYEELLTHNGKVKLRSKMLNYINNKAVDKNVKVERVLVTKFLMD